jgi:hypothetical protein
MFDLVWRSHGESNPGFSLEGARPGCLPWVKSGCSIVLENAPAFIACRHALSECLGPRRTDIKETRSVTREEDVLAALDKPRALYAIQRLVDPSNRSTDALQDLLLRMRAAEKVKFDIKTGRWSKV